MPIKITYIITSLGMGGAEMMLYKLLKYTDLKTIRPTVICLTAEADLIKPIQSLGIEVIVIPYQNRWYNLPLIFFRCHLILRKLCPDIVHTWLYHANVLGGLGAYLLRSRPIIVWNIRNTLSGVTSWSQKAFFLIVKICTHFIPNHILSCSQRGAQEHHLAGFRQKIKVIHNGFLDKPQVMLNNRSIKRIGMIARFTPEKDHYTFLKAVNLFLQKNTQCRFVLVGKGCSTDNHQLQKWIKQFHLSEYIELHEAQISLDDILTTLDIVTLSSYSEGFPNVVGEAMMKGIPCVCTDAGDALILVGKSELIVPIRHPEALAEAWLSVLSMPLDKHLELTLCLRARVLEYFHISKIAHQYNEWHLSLLYP
ncbi:glycosyltransferase [Flectobacillus sp. DC10W]|uniref:Glycosyltransferase n=1 Tax=Flectobacillus longus TaxID=2984207 RepID=A0ABT6YRN1_9BACT|nr:glycosyltransferase [Flectobacillus longus]MDI9866236.1 glycosyltransferase [Flectobacillus longus]